MPRASSLALLQWYGVIPRSPPGGQLELSKLVRPNERDAGRGRQACGRVREEVIGLHRTFGVASPAGRGAEEPYFFVVRDPVHLYYARLGSAIVQRQQFRLPLNLLP